MAGTLKLEIVTPEGPAYCEDVERVTLPGVAGQFGVYPQHVPLMTQMEPGEIIVRKDAEERTETVSDTVRRTEVEIDDDRAAAPTTRPKR